MARRLFVVGTIFGFLSVAFGAFGAHSLETTLEANGRVNTYETDMRYLMFHGLALMGTAWLYTQFQARVLVWAGYLFAGGAVIFSGSLAVLAVLDIEILGAVAPLGGMLLLGGWVCLGMGGWRGLSSSP